MKKFLTLIVLLAILVPQNLFANEEKYIVPVVMEKYMENVKSMGGVALKDTAEITERDGKTIYKLYFKKIDLMGAKGELTNLFIFDTDKDSKRTEAKNEKTGGEFSSVFSFERDKKMEEKINVAIWVDAMDALSGGEKGSGEQLATLKFDLNSKKKISDDKSKNENAKKIEDKNSNEIKIIVNGNKITPESPAYIENGRTMVPLRFISEALNVKVDWEDATKTVVVGENLARLTIGKNEIALKDKTLKLDSPAVIKSSRTYVPLRAISEILGAKVNWNAKDTTVEIIK